MVGAVRTTQHTMASLAVICMMAVAASVLPTEGAPQQHTLNGRTPLRVVRVRVPSRVMTPPLAPTFRGMQRYTQASMRPSPMYGLRRSNRREVPPSSYFGVSENLPIASAQAEPELPPMSPPTQVEYNPEVDGMIAPAFPNMSPPEGAAPPPSQAPEMVAEEVPDRIASEMVGMTAEDVAGMDVPEIPGTIPGASVPVVPVAILSQTQEDDFNGTFNYSFEADNGISVQLKGQPKMLTSGEVVQTMEGRYSYTSPEGTPITTQWFADETGFHAEGAHIPGSTNSLQV